MQISKEEGREWLNEEERREWLSKTGRDHLLEPLPGYGLPVATRSESCSPCALFAIASDDCDGDLLAVREYTMMSIMNEISDKEDWDSKISDDSIVSKWKTEILAQPQVDVSGKMFTECIAELRYKADLFREKHYVEALDGVFKSDKIIGEDHRLELIRAVEPLENVPDDQKDWHPRSDGKVLDLVHPSLYPLIYGKTRLFTQDGESLLGNWRNRLHVGDLSVVETEETEGISEDDDWSRKFQWLPCEVDVGGDDLPKVVSYINNLHPHKHERLYCIIEKIMGKAIELWGPTLSALNDRRSRPSRVIMDGTGYGESTLPEPAYPNDSHDGTASDVQWDKYYEEEQAWKDTRPIIQPEPQPFEDIITWHTSPDRNLFNLHMGQSSITRLQIIVKLATIHLDPSSPNYNGGTWHVEGAANEEICASAIYYYQYTNISESRLSFRQRVEDGSGDLNYEQDDHRAIETIFGFRNEDAAIQNLGSVVTRQGRLIAFPNSMQHRVEPFTLEDPTKPGFRKILALFLVDPHQRIISTANVAPQQPDWWDEHLKLTDQALEGLPQELKDTVKEGFTPLIGLEEAKRLREELMDERTTYAVTSNEEFESGPGFSLCEH